MFQIIDVTIAVARQTDDAFFLALIIHTPTSITKSALRQIIAAVH